MIDTSKMTEEELDAYMAATEPKRWDWTPTYKNWKHEQGETMTILDREFWERYSLSEV